MAATVSTQKISPARPTFHTKNSTNPNPANALAPTLKILLPCALDARVGADPCAPADVADPTTAVDSLTIVPPADEDEPEDVPDTTATTDDVVLATVPTTVEILALTVVAVVPGTMLDVAGEPAVPSSSFQQYLANSDAHADVMSTPVLPRVLSTTAHARAVGHRGSAPPSAVGIPRTVRFDAVARKSVAASRE